MRILVTGAAGVVGAKLCRHLAKHSHQIIPVDIMQRDGILSADLRDETAVLHLAQEYAPELIIHLAAIKSIPYCEQNRATAHATNYGITDHLTRACAESGARFLFFSSDYVFGNSVQPWLEGDSICPTTQYGLDKAASEQLIQKRLTDYAIVRTAQLYGFAGDFVSFVCTALATQQPFIAFANLVNCPTWIGDLFPMVDNIITNHRTGIFHCVGPEAVSRYQFACEIASALGLESNRIEAVNLDFSTDIRPPVVQLNGTSTYETLQIYPGRLQENLPFCANYAMGALDAQ